MHKKIIAIGIISMFLLIGLTTASAVEIKASKIKNTSNGEVSTLYTTEGSLRIRIKKDMVYVSIKPARGWQGTIHTKIIGLNGDKPVLYEDTFTAEGVIHFAPEFSHSIYSDKEFYGKCWVTVTATGSGDDEGLYKQLNAGGIVVGHEFIIYADTPRSRSTHPVFLRLLDLFPNAFPVLRYILELYNQL